MPLPFRFALFDLDCTLVNTWDLLRASFDHAFQTMLHRPVTDAEVHAMLGRPLRESMLDYFPAGDVEEAIRVYRAFNLPRLSAMATSYKGVAEMLLAIQLRGIPYIIVTSKGAEASWATLEAVQLHRNFTEMVTYEDVPRGKPDPAMFLLALERLGAQASEAVMIGDSPHDIQGAHNAGIAACAALWGPFPRETLLAESPEYLAAEPMELVGLFG